MSEAHSENARMDEVTDVSTETSQRQKNIIPLPTTREDLMAQRRTMNGRTLNDYVEDVHIKLWDSEDYRNYLDAVWDEDAIEGSLATDNTMAAQLIRNQARKDAVTQIASRKLATIVKALNVVLRRYQMTRRERANMIGGQVLRGEN